MSNSLPTLDLHVLDSVTGGAPVNGRAGSSNHGELLSTLTGLQGQLKDLSKQPAQSSALGGTNLMLFAMLAMNRPAAQANVVYVRRHGTW